jgi:hypothetical protein
MRPFDKNHEAYAENRAIIATSAIRRLARPSRALTAVTTEAAS